MSVLITLLDSSKNVFLVRLFCFDILTLTKDIKKPLMIEAFKKLLIFTNQNGSSDKSKILNNVKTINSCYI